MPGFRNRDTYFYINFFLLLVFLAVFAWVLVAPSDVRCVYAAEGYSCATCGLTRAFRSLLTGDFSELTAGTRNSAILGFFCYSLVSRLLLVICSLGREAPTRVIGLDILITLAVFTYAFLR